jgi:hypothetical protein
MFLIIGFLTNQILSIVEFQIETKGIFSLVGVLTIFLKCHLEMANLEKLIFVNKNWLNDPRVDYKSSFNLVELIEKDLHLKEYLK